MKLLALAALAALALSAQPAAKPDPTVSAQVTPAPTERSLSETEVLKLSNAALKLKLLGDKFKLDDYRKEAEPIATEQNTLATSLCASVGIPKELIQSQCSIATGLDDNGKAIAGPDGKPVAPRVAWIKPQGPPASAPTGTK